MRALFLFLSVGLMTVGCGVRHGKAGSQVLLEKETPVTVTTNTALVRARFPLPCEAVGFDGPDGTFEPVMLLTSPLPRGASETRPIGSGWPDTVKIYRGTNRVAARNHFLGEFKINGVANEEERSSVEIGFEVTARRELFLYAADETGAKQYGVRPVEATTQR